MTETITITNPMQVKIGDKAYFKDCDFGFDVISVDKRDAIFTLKVNIPMGEDGYWADSSLFDHATREVEEQEWPDPHDAKLHVYLGSDGVRYIYNPADKGDTKPWFIELRYAYHSRESMDADHLDALPLTELKLVPMESES